MSLEIKSKELKTIIANYDTDWLLGNLSALIHAGKQRAGDQLGDLSSPHRQLYYLAGLNVSSDPIVGVDIMYDNETWQKIIDLLNEIEYEYDKLFFPEKPEDVTEEWKRVRKVAMPSFLTYFNQGPLNYEEQVINWITDLFKPLDAIIENKTGLKTADFIAFYNNLDQLVQANFQAHSTRHELLRPDWKKYSKIKMGIADEAPDFIKEMGKEYEPMSYYLSDKGIVDRFYVQELVSTNLSINKVLIALSFLSGKRSETDFLYYTATRPGNPLYEKPIVEIGKNMFQVFEVKQVIHGIYKLLEKVSTSDVADTTKYISQKGKLLENRIVSLFSSFFKNNCKTYTGYFVDECEQDILILWEKYAFIIEAKGYALKEPFRDPEKAFIRIKNDFKACIGYGYDQTRRIEKKFIDEVRLKLYDEKGKEIADIDTKQYDESFSIIVNLESFGQIQCDLSSLLEKETEDDVYPWTIKLDDLEIFLLTMIAKKRPPEDLVDFLISREQLHGKLICSDELDICGGYLTGKLTDKVIEDADMIVTSPDMGNVFDEQYQKTMGFANEKYLYEKQSGKFMFW